MRTLLTLAVVALVARPAAAADFPTAAALTRMTARFAKVPLTADLTTLPESEQRSLVYQIEAARQLDAAFLRQSFAGNEALLLSLAADPSPLGRARLHAFVLNKGPWSRLDHNRAFMPGVPAERPPEGAFYPPNSTKPQIAAWLRSLPATERAEAAGFFTVIRRDPHGHFIVVPYSVAYQEPLARAAALLDEAAQATTQPSLRDYLHERAAAFLSNDYYPSDVAWMKLDASLEPTIGPYEVYEDGWFNDKAAFEAFITVRDAAATTQLARFGAQLQDIENHLPITPAFRNPRLGALAPIRVVNEIYNSGDANHGVQTAAYNLPNDERIERELGTKRVMLKNVQEAKFKSVLLPIARVALAPADRRQVSFDAFFTHILMHELMHGLGPHAVMAAPGHLGTTTRQALQDAYSSIEEAKADISGLFAMQYLIDKGVLPRTLEKSMYSTYLASAFRAIRFGLAEAHGRGVAMQLDYLMDAGAVRHLANGTFTAVPDKMKTAVIALTHELMTIEATGDRARAEALLGKLGVVRPEVRRVLDRLGAIPVDIDPQFVTAEKLLAKYR